MNKISSQLFAVVLILTMTLVGCGGGQDEANEPSATEATTPTANEPGRDVEQAADAVTDRMEESAEMDDDTAERAEQAMAEAADAMAPEDGTETGAQGQASEGAAGGDSGDPCVINVEVGDSIAYSRDSISVPSSCSSVTINLEHTGSLPREAMGHNWVLVPADAVQAIGMAGMSAGMESGYLPDDDRIVAATDLIGGGESTSVTFAVGDLDAGTDYAYVCTFPGHWSAMRGTFSIE